MKTDLLIRIEKDLAEFQRTKQKQKAAALTRVIEQTDAYSAHLGGADLDEIKVRKCVLLVVTAYRLSLPQCTGPSIAYVTENIATLEPYLLEEKAA